MASSLVVTSHESLITRESCVTYNLLQIVKIVLRLHNLVGSCGPLRTNGEDGVNCSILKELVIGTERQPVGNKVHIATVTNSATNKELTGTDCQPIRISTQKGLLAGTECLPVESKVQIVAGS